MRLPARIRNLLLSVSPNTAMSELDHPFWLDWRKRRRLQVRIGQISALFFLFAALALLDGLQMLVRTDTNEITLLAGEKEGLSGPCPFQNPVESDFAVHFSPVKLS